MILHTLNCPPSSASFQQCLDHVAPDDALLLMGDGVYGTLDHVDALAVLADTGAKIYLLADDVAAAGVPTETGHWTLLDMPGFVALTEQFQRQLAWY